MGLDRLRTQVTRRLDIFVQEVMYMKTWKIPIVFANWAIIEVEADTLAEAIKIAQDDNGEIPIPDDSYYIDDSWEVDHADDEDFLRECYNKGQEDE